MYVGAEVAVGSFIIRYGQFLNIQGFTLKMGARFVSYYMLLAMISRFIGIFIIGKYIKQENILRYYSTVAFILILVSVSSNGIFALWCIVAIGACNAIMWPTIFPLAIAGLGKHTKKASSYLIMAILGGAIIPMLVGYFSDKIGIQFAYLINAIAYAYVAFYGFVGYKLNKNKVGMSLLKPV
jgi:FHS family L-fucose permease-like MFS transporter